MAIVLLTVGQNDCDVLFLAQYLGWQQTFEIQMKRFLVRPRPIHTNTTRACLVGRNVQQILFGGGIRSYIPRCIDTVEPCRCSHNVFLHHYIIHHIHGDKKSCRKMVKCKIQRIGCGRRRLMCRHTNGGQHLAIRGLVRRNGNIGPHCGQGAAHSSIPSIYFLR